MKNWTHPSFLFVFWAAALTAGESSLLYFEAQSVVGYSTHYGDVYRSGMPDDAMQLNSIGFDYLKKFSGDSGDIGSAALQARLAYNQDKNEVEPQLYNAYLKGKTPFADIWAGHNRIAFGLASYWDTHGTLLQPLPMYGFGFDRDWGVGLSRDTEHGNMQATLSSGTGMDYRSNGNWIFAPRISDGVLGVDNYTAGLSFMAGRTLDTMGYTVMDGDPKDVALGAVDFAYNHDNIEHKAELDVGSKDGMPAFAALYRIGVNFMEEDRLKLEGQYVYTDREEMRDHALGTGVTYKLTSELAIRIMYEWRREMDEHRVIGQLYYYFGV